MRLSKGAIATGIVTGILFSFAAMLLLLLVEMLLGGFTDDERIQNQLSDPVYLAAAFVITAMPTALAGFVSGVYARRDHVRHAVSVGAVLLAALLVVYIALSAVLPSGPSKPPLYHFLVFAATVPAAMLGGRLSVGRHL